LLHRHTAVVSIFAPPITPSFGFPKCSNVRRTPILLARAAHAEVASFEPNKEYR